VIADEISRQLGLLIEDLETPRGLAASSVRVTLTQPAEVPVDRSSPRMLLNLLLGVAAGASIGLVLALLRHHLDRRLTSVEDVRAVTGATPLGATIGPRRPADGDPLVALQVRSPGAERYRTIRSALRFTDVDHQLRHFAVSSPAGGDGTPAVAANLAISWALAGSRVCLVDAGLRHPMAPDVFGAGSTPGLTDVLVGDVDLDTALTPWNDGLLTLLPTGSAPGDPVEVLGSRAMTHLVAELRARFDVVIYAAEPMLTVADAIVLARALDGLVMVVRAGVTTTDQLRSCLELVSEARLRLLGTVWTGERPRRRRAASAPLPGDVPAHPDRRSRTSGRRADPGQQRAAASTRPLDDPVREHRRREEDDEGGGGVEHAALEHAHEGD
jgi:non-specific protein-tyrosine kinase